MENGHFSTKFKRFFFTFLSLKGSLKQWKKVTTLAGPERGWLVCWLKMLKFAQSKENSEFGQ